MPPPAAAPIQVALIDDYDVVLTGLAGMLAPYRDRDRVQVAETDANRPLATPVDIALFDSFAQSEADGQIDVLVASPLAWHVVIYTWTFKPDLITKVRRRGVSGYLSKTLAARDLVDALEGVHAGHCIISDPPPPRARVTPGLDWPGRGEGLTDREAEILALITQGKSNAGVAALTYLSPNTVKSYIRSLYREIRVGSRTQAVLWGVDHGFTPDHHRIDYWRRRP